MALRSSFELPAYTKTVPTLASTVGAPDGAQFAFKYHDSRKRTGASGVLDAVKAAALFDESISAGRYEVKHATRGEGVELARSHTYKPFREFLTISVIE